MVPFSREASYLKGSCSLLVPSRTNASYQSIWRTKIGNHLMDSAQRTGPSLGPAAGILPHSARLPEEVSGTQRGPSYGDQSVTCMSPHRPFGTNPQFCAYRGRSPPKARGGGRCPRWEAGGTSVSSASGLSRLSPSRRHPGRAAGPRRQVSAAHFPSGRAKAAGRPPSQGREPRLAEDPAGQGRAVCVGKGGSPLPQGRPPAALPGPHPARGRWRRHAASREG